MSRPDPLETLAPPARRSGCVRALLRCGCALFLLALAACIGFGVLYARFVQRQGALDGRVAAAERRLERPFVQAPDAQLEEAKLVAFLGAREALRREVEARPTGLIGYTARREAGVRLVERRAELLEAAGLGRAEWAWIAAIVFTTSPEALPPATQALLAKHRARIDAARGDGLDDALWETIEAEARGPSTRSHGDLFD